MSHPTAIITADQYVRVDVLERVSRGWFARIRTPHTAYVIRDHDGTYAHLDVGGYPIELPAGVSFLREVAVAEAIAGRAS